MVLPTSLRSSLASALQPDQTHRKAFVFGEGQGAYRLIDEANSRGIYCTTRNSQETAHSPPKGPWPELS